jgi:hypothetical protein
MKLSLKQYGKTVTIEIEEDEMSMYELTEEFRCLALGHGYLPETVEVAIPDQDTLDSMLYDVLNEGMN